MEKLLISTSAFAAGDQTEAFRETFGRSILRIDIEPLHGQVLESEMLLQRLPGVGVASGFASPVHCRHAGNLIDNDDLVLSFTLGGYSVLNQHGRKTEVGDGDVVLTANGEPATFLHPTWIRVLNLRLSRERLAPRLRDIGAIFHAPLLRDGPALRLLKGYTRILQSNDLLTTPALGDAVATHLYDLAALALGATQDAAAVAKGRGVRAARLHAIKNDILERLTSSDLSIDMIARLHKISSSYIRQLFADEHTTFADFVLEQRLALAHRILTGPRISPRPISQVALDCGFGDLTYFNQTFRRRYGRTPEDIRAEALGI
ncbi:MULTISPECIES: AraC family transcriptional regulator [unclassified Sinorhizobium]|uniref:AraC family transcriptional regulator n=1 Tax=unclassified Sinorhizobium TaxID=2613772 RepID=UPI003523D840